MSKRCAEDAEWERHKATILSLYVDLDMALPEVIPIMAQQQGFSRTKSQYERMFKRWGVSKNISKHEWEYIVHKLQQREAQGKPSIVRVRGVVHPQSKIQKQRKKYEFKTTFDRLVLGSKSQPPETPKAPTEVQVFSQPPSPRFEEEGIRNQLITTVDYCGPTYSDFFLIWANRTPWQHCSNLFDTIHDRINMHMHISGLIESTLMQRVHGGILAEYLKTRSGEWPTQLLYWKRLMPPVQNYTSVNFEFAQSKLFRTSSMLEVLRLLVGFSSNNLNVRKIATLVVWLVRDKSNYAVLQWLVQQDLVSVRAFTEKLLVSAVNDNNLTLVKLLVESGVSVDIRVDFHDWPGVPVSPIECAVMNGFENIVAYLLRHGVSDWNASHEVVWGRSFCSVSDLAFEKTNYSLLKLLLEYRPSIDSTTLQNSLRTLRLAVLQNRIDLANLILEHGPELLQCIQERPCIILEAAALQGGEHMIEHLLSKGLDINRTDLDGSGSVLAVACKKQPLGFIRRLLAANVDVNGVVRVIDLFGREERDFFKGEEELAGLHGMSALHIAIQRGDPELVDMLLRHGADANKLGIMYPIQTAAWCGDVEIVKMLVKANVEINAFHNYREGSAIRINGNYILNHKAIHIAMNEGHVTIVDILYKAGAGILQRHYFDRDGITYRWDPWIQALLRGCNFVRSIMNEQYISQEKSAESAAACLEQHGIEFTKEFMQMGLPALVEKFLPSVLCAAVAVGDRALIKEIFSMGTKSLEGVPLSSSGRALLVAVRSQQKDVVLDLLNFGVNPFEIMSFKSNDEILNYIDRVYDFGDKESAFGYSTAGGQLDMAEVFLQYSIDPVQYAPALLRKQNLSEQYVKALCSGSNEIAERIAQEGINIFEIDGVLGCGYMEGELYVGFEKAISQQRFALAERLLEIGFDLNGDMNFANEDFCDLTYVQLAALNNQAHIVELLLRNGAHVNTGPKISYRATALQYAAFQGNFEITNLLLKAGADINAPPSAFEGRTAIEGAAEWGRLDMVRYLLEAGADIQCRKNYRRTVYRAWTKGHHALAQMIQEWKTEHHGPEDCESTATIVASMTSDELKYASEDAKKRYLEFMEDQRRKIEEAVKNEEAVRRMTKPMKIIHYSQMDFDSFNP
ncbi:ankyrin repeat-containing domain protein [Pyrenochaeta sp. MPI-SDFR-AT-0127]|nr:ankyrin repeat-containing domain protein [Pyrenochaeta sp. MPI-SDFR-AT-0127]